MRRLPTTALTEAATVLQGREKSVTQERLRISQQSVPVTSGNLMDRIQAGQQHQQ